MRCRRLYWVICVCDRIYEAIDGDCECLSWKEHPLATAQQRIWQNPVTYPQSHKPLQQRHIQFPQVNYNFPKAILRIHRYFLIYPIQLYQQILFEYPRNPSARWVHYHVSMPNQTLDPKLVLYTRFAIFLYAYQLETALLTRRAALDAADAERLVLPSAPSRRERIHPSQRSIKPKEIQQR